MQEQQHSQPNISTRKVHRTAIHPLFLALLLANGAQAGDVEPSAGPMAFRIEPQSLDRALVEFSAASGQQVVVDGKLSTGVHSPGVSGSYTPRQALDKLLEGTGIAARVNRNGTVTLEKAKAAEPQSMAVDLPKVTVSGTAAYDPTDPYDQNYAVPDSFAATKTDTPLMETPASIQVVPRAVMDDQQAIRLEDVVRNVSGVQVKRQLGDLFDSFIIRGFDTQFRVYRDGLRLAEQSFETANLDRTEVLKGPASALFGRIEPGGLVNMVTKKPLTERYYSLGQQFGSFDLYRTTLDATGPVTDNGDLSYRLNFVYLDSGSFRDFIDRERKFVAPQLTWRLTENTDINFGYEFKDDAVKGDRGIPAIGNRPAKVPISRFIGEPDFSLNEAESHLGHITWTHRFNDDWRVQQKFVINFVDTFNRNIIPVSLRGDNRTINRGLFNGSTERETYATDINLNGKFDVFGTRHNVLVGFDFLRFQSSRGVTFLGSAAFIPTLDTFNPVYGIRIPDNLPINNFFSTKQQWFGVYLQDQIDLTHNLHLLFSGRYDWSENASGLSSTGSPKLDTVRNNEFSPRVGLLFSPRDWLSLYADWTHALGAANAGQSADGKPFDPEFAEQFEGGVKLELFDGRFNANLAVYELTKENILTAARIDPSTATGPSIQEAIGKARSRGIEFDFAGHLTDEFSLIGSYAYTDTRVLNDNNGNEGHRLPNVPEHAGSLWVNYELPFGFKLGTGVYISDKRQGNAQNDVQLPGYVRWDAMAAYQWNIGVSKITAQVNVNNILDKEYYKFLDIAGNPRFDINPGEPLSVIGSLKLEY